MSVETSERERKIGFFFYYSFNRAISKRAKCDFCAAEVNLMIMHLNDTHKMSFIQIAEWLEKHEDMNVDLNEGVSTLKAFFGHGDNMEACLLCGNRNCDRLCGMNVNS